MTFLFFAFLIGVAAGLRSMVPFAAVSIGARTGALPLAGSPLAFLGAFVLIIVFVIGAVAELVFEKRSGMPSRKAAGPFAFRIVSGAVAGGAIGAAHGALLFGLLAGAIGAFAGTLGGYAARMRLAAAAGRDLPVALVEDAIAIGLAALAVAAS